MPQQQAAVLLVGFHPEETDIISDKLPARVQELGAHMTRPGAAGGGDGAIHLLCVGRARLEHTVAEVLFADSQRPGATVQELNDQAAPEVGRIVLLVGPVAQQLGATLNDDLVAWGVAPALIAGYQKRHKAVPLRALAYSLRAAHAEMYELLQPVRLQLADEGVPAATPAQALTPTATGSAAAAVPPAAAGVQPAAPGFEVESVLDEASVILSAVLDAGEVPSIQGHYRRDEGHLVVLDGLLPPEERQQLLDWLTSSGHNHSGPPPQDKWEMSCVDRPGDQETWGLQVDVLSLLRERPPAPVVALQARLAALYPEYTVCHMPAQQISDSGGADPDSDTPLSSFVGNAVMPGDPCHWHLDADPSAIPPHSPWIHNFGYYHNREPHRPLFVSVLLYLNDAWAEDFHAETLFLDPETQLGLFVRPAPGRVVLMDQDVAHRISAPSRQAPGPRYSLVWKLVLVPKATPGAGADDGTTTLLSICRPEWGEPVRIGSASRACGVRARQLKP